MRFSIYLRRRELYYRLYKFHRSSKGLYSFTQDGKSYDSWHDDGKFWTRSLGQMTQKRYRQPLQKFTGCESIYNSVIAVLVPDPASAKSYVRVGSEDIVLEIDGIVATEVILSDAPVALTPLPSRPDSVVHVWLGMRPILTLEAWSLSDGVFPVPRYRSPVTWVEGDNLFFDHKGRI